MLRIRLQMRLDVGAAGGIKLAVHVGAKFGFDLFSIGHNATGTQVILLPNNSNVMLLAINLLQAWSGSRMKSTAGASDLALGEA